MDLEINQPIAALASAPGGGGRGIIRVSGGDVQSVLDGWFIPDHPDNWKSAKSAGSHLGRLVLNPGNQPVQCPAQVLYWPHRRSYTGQPLLELHLSGSPCLLEAVLAEIYQHQVRAARPGEFTLRAFLAGKLDLLQAEAVLGVIDAHNQTELKTALAQLAGGVSSQLGELRGNLLELLADLEAGLDFVDEDIEFVSRSEVLTRLQTAHQFVEDLMAQANDRMQARVRQKVVLAGLPNAGKSTLFNQLAGSEFALVSPEQGTTRDFLSTPIDWNGFSFDLIDTAGWENQLEGIDALAQKRRQEQLQQADLLIWCTSAILNESDSTIDTRLFLDARPQFAHAIQVLTKADELTKGGPRQLGDFDQTGCRSSPLPISAIQKTGLQELLSQIKQLLTTGQSPRGQWLGMTAVRCRETLGSTLMSLARSIESARDEQVGDELISVDLRDSLDQLGTILGVIYTDDVLDRIFSKFCIGK